MLGTFYNVIFYKPLYNGLVFLIDKVPFHDLGFAVVALTLIVRLILFPFVHKSTITQKKIKDIAPEVDSIKKKLKDNKEEQAKQIMALYKKHGISPFSSFLVAIIQIPILLTLFIIIKKGISFDAGMLYSFVGLPTQIHTVFLGIFDMLKPSYFLAITAGLSQYVQTKMMLPAANKQNKDKGKKSFTDELQKSLSTQTKYIMPIFVAFVASRFSAALPLYWTTSNLFAILHEIIVKKKAEKIDGTNTNN